MSDPSRILVVDDVREHAEMVGEFLRAGSACKGAECEIAASYDEALRAFERRRFDVALVDYALGARTGLTLLREVRARGIRTPVVVLTGHGAEEVAVEAMRAGASDYLNKATLTVEALDRSIRHVLALHAEHSALLASEARFRALVENSSDALLLIDADGRVTYVAPSAGRHVGWTQHQMAGRSLFEFIHENDLEAARLKLAEAWRRPGVPVSAEVRFRHADGSWRIVEGVGVNRLDDPFVQAIIITARDITDRRRLEEQFRMSQKMEAIGQLAGGVAHDFNNLLTAILGYCNLLLEETPPGSPQRPDLEEIRAAGERAASLTRQLLAFSRRQMLQPRIVDVSELIDQLEKLLRRLISEDVELVTKLADDLPPVRVDPASVEQILINLVVNARDAIARGGRITIETAHVELGSRLGDAPVEIVPGPYVLMSIADDGHGMDAATRSRVFEPFFTTKEQGRGTGLGLATVYGIVKQSGGYIFVESEPAHGTVFKVYFPGVQTPAAAAAREAGAAPPSRGSETVLLVEDEDAVRALAREVLRRHGYAVIEARHGVDALDVVEHHAAAIDLMITDVVMPHMSGRDLAERLSRVRPAMKVLFMSGYTDHAAVHRDLTPGTAFLQKPFTPDAFARKVRQVLDEPANV
jgi:two-component system cell cycle sensor histidine kinase/response regulator CckA